MTASWKTNTADLRALAASVLEQGTEPEMSARTAARCFIGVVRLVSERWGQDAMQIACAELVRDARAWTTQMRWLPCAQTGHAVEPMHLIAVVAAGLLGVAGVRNVRAALAFWASEDSPTAWRDVIG